jgi:hypothetical protein
MVRRTTLLVLAALLLAGLTAQGADEKGRPVGKWERSSGDTKIVFDIAADNMKVAISDSSGNSIKVEASYTVKDGVLSGVVKKVEKVGVDAGPNEGDKFSFAFKVEKDQLTISDLKGPESEEAKNLVQGEYKKVK